LSRAPAQHRKPSRSSSTRSSRRTRHRKPSLVASALQHKPARLAAAVASSALLVSAAWQAAPHWPGDKPRPARTGSADTLQAAGADVRASPFTGAGPKARPGAAGFLRLPVPHASSSAALPAIQRRRQTQAPAQPVYRNPLRGVSGLVPERIDMGVDFGGSGPVYAIGDAVITDATGDSAGWPGGGWITYRLTDGPAAGLMVYLAEDVTPAVHAGQHVSSATVIASMSDAGDGIETGWAMPDGASAESQLPVAGGISGGGPFPTRIGLSFEELLQSLGVPAASNRTQAPFGLLPANYPAS